MSNYHKLTEHDWYYEETDGIHLRHEVLDIENKAFRSDEIILRWSRLKAAVNRKRAQEKRKGPKPDFESAKEIEYAIARYFGARQHVIVPNVSWGLFPYEMDMVILQQSLYADEVEIKISKQDLKRDHKKYHRHDSIMMRRLWFAIPEKLNNPSCLDLIPETAGILVVARSGFVDHIRDPKLNNAARKFTESEAFQLARLGAIRVWDLKYKILHPKTRELYKGQEIE